MIEELRRDLADVDGAIRSHRLLAGLEARRVPEGRLRALAGEQFAIVTSDRRSFALLAARYPAGPAGDFFLSMADGEGQALSLLDGFAGWLGMARTTSSPTSRGRERRRTRLSSPRSP